MAITVTHNGVTYNDPQAIRAAVESNKLKFAEAMNLMEEYSKLQAQAIVAAQTTADAGISFKASGYAVDVKGLGMTWKGVWTSVAKIRQFQSAECIAAFEAFVASHSGELKLSADDHRFDVEIAAARAEREAKKKAS